MSIDNSFARYPAYSPFNFVLNSPIILLDGDGNDPISALIEAVTAMGLEIALQVTPSLLSGDDLSEALNDIEWFDVIAEGTTNFVGSFFFSGSGLAKKIKKIEKSAQGKLLIKFISTLVTDVIKDYEKGAFDIDGEFDFDKFLEEFGRIVEVSAYKALASQGYSDKAEKLYQRVAKTNKRLQKHYKKLDRSLQRGASQKTIDRRMEEIDKAQKEIIKRSLEAGTGKSLDKSVDKSAEELAKTVQEKRSKKNKKRKIKRHSKASF